MDRKTFLFQTGLAATSLLASESLMAFAGSPANKVRIGVMGVYSRGLFLSQSFAKLKDVEVAYICDVDKNALDKAIEAVAKISGKKPQGFTDIRKMLEQ